MFNNRGLAQISVSVSTTRGTQLPLETFGPPGILGKCRFWGPWAEILYFFSLLFLVGEGMLHGLQDLFSHRGLNTGHRSESPES